VCDKFNADVSTIREIIAETKAQEARRAVLTWQVVQERRYAAMHEWWTRRRQGEREGSAFRSLGDQSERTI
jgi:hypothetical protein